MGGIKSLPLPSFVGGTLECGPEPRFLDDDGDGNNGNGIGYEISNDGEGDGSNGESSSGRGYGVPVVYASSFFLRAANTNRFVYCGEENTCVHGTVIRNSSLMTFHGIDGDQINYRGATDLKKVQANDTVTVYANIKTGGQYLCPVPPTSEAKISTQKLLNNKSNTNDNSKGTSRDGVNNNNNNNNNSGNSNNSNNGGHGVSSQSSTSASASTLTSPKSSSSTNTTTPTNASISKNKKLYWVGDSNTVKANEEKVFQFIVRRVDPKHQSKKKSKPMSLDGSIGRSLSFRRLKNYISRRSSQTENTNELQSCQPTNKGSRTPPPRLRRPTSPNGCDADVVVGDGGGRRAITPPSGQQHEGRSLQHFGGSNGDSNGQALGGRETGQIEEDEGNRLMSAIGADQTTTTTKDGESTTEAERQQDQQQQQEQETREQIEETINSSSSATKKLEGKDDPLLMGDVITLESKAKPGHFLIAKSSGQIKLSSSEVGHFVIAVPQLRDLVELEGDYDSQPLERMIDEPTQKRKGANAVEARWLLLLQRLPLDIVYKILQYKGRWKRIARLVSRDWCRAAELHVHGIRAAARNFELAFSPTERQSLIAFIGRCSHLTRLTLRNMDEIQDGDLSCLPSNCTYLRTVSLGGCCELGDGCIDYLVGLKQLSVLNLAYTQVTDHGLLQIAEKLPSLTCLNFYGCRRITPYGVWLVMQKLPKLNSLNLRGTVLEKEVTDEMQRRVPRVTLLTGPLDPESIYS